MKKIISNITYTIFILIVLGLVFLLMAPPIPGVGNIEVKIVKSGSMEPTIMTGAVVAIHEIESYKVGDIITFADKNAKIPTTHRIIDTENINGKSYFITKGDANEDRDAKPVPAGDVIGKVVFDIPYVGFMLDFARQPLGFGLLVGIPAFLIVLDELIKIWLEVRRMRGLRFDKDMVVPLVITPYDPNSSKQKVKKIQTANSLRKVNLKVDLPTRVVKTKKMDIEPTGKTRKMIEPSTGKIVEQKNSYNFSHDIRPQASTVVAGFVLLVFVSMQMLGDMTTFAYPTDTEISFANSMQATAVDFSIFASKTNFLTEDDNILGTTTTEVSIDLDNRVKESLVYKIEVKESGASALCGLITVKAEAPLSYNGNLLNLNKTETIIGNDFLLDFSLSDFYYGVTPCIVDLIFTAYLDGETAGSGYIDTEIVTFEFTRNIAEPAMTLPLVIDSQTFISSNDSEEKNGEEQTIEEFIEKPTIPTEDKEEMLGQIDENEIEQNTNQNNQEEKENNINEQADVNDKSSETKVDVVEEIIVEEVVEELVEENNEVVEEVIEEPEKKIEETVVIDEIEI
ncbi:MAG: signal peptidase I [Candidatus Paceibacterota bacterium]